MFHTGTTRMYSQYVQSTVSTGNERTARAALGVGKNFFCILHTSIIRSQVLDDECSLSLFPLSRAQGCRLR